MKPYPGYKNLPPLAGIATMEQAAKPGYSVEACVTRLKRWHYACRRLHGTLLAHLTSEPVYELKSAFSLHAYLCSELADAIRRRVGEMREPPLGLETVPDPNLEIFFDEIHAAPDTVPLVLGLYEKALPALHEAFSGHMRTTNPLADYPTRRFCRMALIDLEDMLAFGRQTLDALVTDSDRESFDDWLRLLDEALRAAGGLDGRDAVSGTLAERRFSANPPPYDPVPRRDERFQDPYNMGVNAEVFLYDPSHSPSAKVLMMFYKRLREIDVPEMMASILTETRGKPWGYYRDMTRQLWDEARHAMMGEVGFARLGIDWSKYVRVNFTWSLALNTQLTPRERHAVLYFIEQGLMPRNGKRFEWEIGQAAGDPLAALFQDFDWADEVLHARIGRDWFVKDFSNPADAVAYGDRCWSQVLMNWQTWKDQGLTQHENWWPALYREACRLAGTEPDEAVLKFNSSYADVRADLKPLTGSG